MNTLSYENHAGTPVFKCSPCGRCSGIETENVFAANRGCCFYFPKYTLISLRAIALAAPGFIGELLANPNTVIHPDHLVVRGHYDEAAHQAFRQDRERSGHEKYRGFDTSLLFRKCSFCTDSGCAIDFRLRPFPCNLYLCRGVIAQCGERYRDFGRERKDYFAYCHYINGLLADELAGRGLSLTGDFDAVIAVLRETDVPAFEFAPLDPITFGVVG